MEVGRLWKPSMPEIKVYRRKTGAWRVKKKTQSSVKENPEAGDINYGEIAHGKDMGINSAIHDVIARLRYCHHAELSMHFFERI